MNLRCLTILQPWASLIIGGIKHFETRSWNPANAAFGPFHGAFGMVAIHAGKSKAWEHVREKEPYITALGACGIGENDPLPFGAILGTVEFLAVHPAVAIANQHDYRRGGPKDLEIRLGNFAPSRWAWEFARVKRFDKPLPWKGAQGFWVADIRPHHFPADVGTPR
jgi:activating signal cointegrator 1